MSDFVDAFSSDTLDVLRREIRSGTPANGETILPGAYLGWDAEQGEVALSYDSPSWAALSLDYSVTGTPGWLSLSLVLGDGLFEPGDTLGLAVEGYADADCALVPLLRSSIGDESIDTDWSDRIELTTVNDVSVALCRFEDTAEETGSVTGRSGFHTLILGLPTQGAAITLRNLRLFRTPAPRTS